MSEQRVIARSEGGGDEDARRQRACSQISVMTYFTEPRWSVLLNPFERRVVLTIGNRSFGDSNSGNEDVMSPNFGTPDTLQALGTALIEGSRQLAPIVADHTPAE
jgi:hypothetical protein